MIGKTLSHYKVLEKIGQGGMGEVYRAEDTNLSREVAIKVLPEQFTQDPQRLARFEREAKLLASLNHPNIAAIHSFEHADEVHFLVLELVPGETLAERVAKGPVPVEEALEVCRQIAEGVEAAHEKGVIHRDLKPANVKVTPEGKVKILDFGLAKAFEAEPPVTDISQSPTLTEEMTRAGVILGTAAYMSPEQAKGKPVDKRADIFAFGAVLYELLTGKRAFGGETITETLASILKSEPDWEKLPGNTPWNIRTLLRRCLHKETNRRLQHIGDVRIEIEEALTTPATGIPGATTAISAGTGWRQVMPWALVGVLAMATAILGLGLVRDLEPTPMPPVRFSITVPLEEQVVQGGLVALSDDGIQVAYVSRLDGIDRICIRALDEWESQCIAGTEGARDPFFSPDGRQIGFSGENFEGLKVIDLDTGTTTELADRSAMGASWHPDGDSIIFNRNFAQGLSRIPATGGTATILTTPDAEKELGHWWPQILPDGKTVIFSVYATPVDNARVAALRLDSGEIVTLQSGALFGRYVDTGHLLFVRSDTLMAAPFDLESLEVTGPERAVLKDVFFNLNDGESAFAISRNGTLAYLPSAALRELVWVDLNGNEEKVSERRGAFRVPSLSPDGQEIAYQLIDQGKSEIWTYDIRRDNPSRFAAGDNPKLTPLWSPNGNHIVFQSEQLVWNLVWQSKDDRIEEPLVTNDQDQYPTSFSPDGRFLVYHEDNLDTELDIWILSIDDLQSELFLRTPFRESHGVVSPNGDLIAYQSDRDGRDEVYIQPFPSPGTDYKKVSIDGGVDPQWAPDGQTLFYRSSGLMMAVEFDADFVPGIPEVLFPDTYDIDEQWRLSYDIADDGRFLMVKTPPELVPKQINVILNWSEELKRLVPTNEP